MKLRNLSFYIPFYSLLLWGSSPEGSLGQSAPAADFQADHTLSCDGTFHFEDLTDNGADSWEWDFGDGNTSTAQDPTHTYSSAGTYTVELIATNSTGSDTIEKVDFISYDPNRSTPSGPNCTPSTQNSQSGFGIQHVSFNSLNVSSGDAASEGYQDSTCLQTEVYEGQTHSLSMITDDPTTHNAKAWIDWNDDGVLDNDNEVVLDQESVSYPSDSFMIPSTAAIDTPLRMRVMADYDVGTPPLTPCTDPEFGQAEDYTVRVLDNPFPPEVDFSVSDSITCDGTVQFFDKSENVPTSWQWSFGDGNASTAQNPVHTYTSSGFYSVKLIAGKGGSSDTIVKHHVVEVDLSAQVRPPSCTPNTLSYCCDYGIYDVEFGSIKNASDDASEGYRDFSCGSHAELIEGETYNINISTGPSNQQDTRVWIDYDSSGTFEPGEMVFEALGQYNPSGSIQIPTDSVMDVPLRMRVVSDHAGSDPRPCKDPQNGQVEDYGVTVVENNAPPDADFEADSNYTCSGTVFFKDKTQYAPTSWEWDFGDGSTSTAQNPTHTYNSSGTYTVSLIASNQNGSDTVTKTNYMTVDLETACDTFYMPSTGSNSSNVCRGVLMDDGGMDDYSPNSNGVFTIAPANGNSVNLNFEYFNMQFIWDSLIIYDGPSTNSPRIGGYTGSELPEGGRITSSGDAITLEQISDDVFQERGFLLEWSCSVGMEEDRITGPTELKLFPNPASDRLRIRYQGRGDPPERFTIFGPRGRQLRTLHNEGKKEWSMDVKPMSPGIYLLRWKGREGSPRTRRFVVQ